VGLADHHRKVESFTSMSKILRDLLRKQRNSALSATFQNDELLAASNARSDCYHFCYFDIQSTALIRPPIIFLKRQVATNFVNP
jgi:hypothetical protein